MTHSSDALADPWMAWRRKAVAPTQASSLLDKLAVDLFHVAGIGLCVWMLMR